MAHWTALHFDVSKMLSSFPLKHVKIEGLSVTLTVDLDEKAYKFLEKDPYWIQKMTDLGQRRMKGAVAKLVTKVVVADKQAEILEGHDVDLLTRGIDVEAKKEMEAAGHELAAEVDKLFEEYKHGQTELRNFKIKSGVKIGMNGVAIVGAVAVAGATHGALAPAAVVAIARSGIVITQECVKLATTADQIAVFIQAELKGLGHVFSTNMQNADTMKKVKQAGKEISLGVLSAVLGVEIPNLKNCKGRIDVHKVDIAKMDKEARELGKSIHGLYDEQLRLQGKVEAAIVNKPEKLKKYKAAEAKCAAVLKGVLESTTKLNEGVQKANHRQEVFEKAWHAMNDGIPGWVQYVQTAVTLGIDVGLAVGGAGTAMEQGLAALIAIEIDAAAAIADEV